MNSTKPPATRPPAALSCAGLAAWCSVPAALIAQLFVDPSSLSWQDQAGIGAKGAEATVMSQGQVGSMQGQGDTCRSAAASGNSSWICKLGRMVS